MEKIICPIDINTKAKAKEYVRGINFTLISVSTVFGFACQCIFSPCGQTGDRTVTQMRHPLLVKAALVQRESGLKLQIFLKHDLPAR